ncbi:MAG: hypothetical protein COW08_05070 [Ignavibacteriales bacterium CG12_big_fil_rev_8_21_14_0_65_30_8]|nr:MAG: hypothetical protein COW08_05070 [Ignavibacteriales bacterium CG12_big_fil_rev_8_21_14_0_65_30_8]
MKNRILSAIFIFIISFSFICAQKLNCENADIDWLREQLSNNKDLYTFIVNKKKIIEQWGKKSAEYYIKQEITSYINGRISEKEFNENILRILFRTAAFKNMDKGILDEIRELEKCLANKLADQNKTKKLGIAYVLKKSDPIINSKKTRLSFVSGANYETSISESSFNLHKFQKDSKG